MSRLELRRLTQSFGDTRVQSGLDPGVLDGEFVVDVGPLPRPAGALRIAGECLRPRPRPGVVHVFADRSHRVALQAA